MVTADQSQFLKEVIKFWVGYAPSSNAFPKIWMEVDEEVIINKRELDTPITHKSLRRK